MKVAFLGLFCVALLNGVASFSVQVPAIKTVCKTMVPGHDRVKPQTGPSPFSVTLDKSSVSNGGTVDVTVQGQGGRTFKGFYIQARDGNGNPIGTFSPNANAKTHNCGGIPGNGAHHLSPEQKSKVTVTWKSPGNYRGPIQIQGTVVQEYNTFWTPIKASILSVS